MSIQDKIREMFKTGDIIIYGNVCEVLEVEPKTGKQKQIHFQLFEQYVKLEKVGRGKFKIVEIYDTPIIREDGRKNNGDNAKTFKNGELEDAILSIIHDDCIKFYSDILDYVFSEERQAKNEVRSLTYSLRNFSIMCGLMSSNFDSIDDEKEIVQEIYGEDAKKYVDGTVSYTIERVTTTLGSLKDKKLILQGAYTRMIAYSFDEKNNKPLLRLPTKEENHIIDEKEKMTVDWFNNEFIRDNKGNIKKGYWTVETYSDIFMKFRKKRNIFKVSEHCYELCKKEISNYISHLKRIYIEYETDVIKNIELEHDTQYYVQVVNEVNSTKKIENAQNYVDKERNMMKEIKAKIEEESKTVKGFGHIEYIKYVKMCQAMNEFYAEKDKDKKKKRNIDVSALAMCTTMTELEQVVESRLKKTVELKGITYCEKYIDQIENEEERQIMKARLDYICFENDTKLTNGNLISDLMALGAIAKVSGYVESKKDYVLKEIELHKDCTIEVIKTENRQKHISLDTHTYDELANQLNLPDCDYLRVIVNYKYDTETGKGYVECSLAGEEDFTLKTVEVKTGMTIEEIVEKVNLDDIAFEELYDEYGNVITEKHIADVTLRGYSEVIVPYMTFRVSCIDEVKDFIRHIGYIRNLRGVSVDTPRSIAERKGEELC